ncbi:MAG: hypothetical protein M3Z10_00360 [Gemmatimonadota bacterium]|nr:hypothetical protein [Gemmatimonadota bacterium]
MLVASSACSDATAPSSLTAPRGATAYEGTQSGYEGTQSGQNDDGWRGQTSFQVTIDPHARNELHFGSYTLSLPANSVCRFADSGYGIDAFDDSCAVESGPITIRAKLSVDTDGRQRIDLQPRMRFTPNKSVVLSKYVGQAALLSADSWRILFCPAAADLQGCVDESLLDESLTTRIDFERGLIYRRIKHFSGYLAAES